MEIGLDRATLGSAGVSGPCTGSIWSVEMDFILSLTLTIRDLVTAPLKMGISIAMIKSVAITTVLSHTILNQKLFYVSTGMPLSRKILLMQIPPIMGPNLFINQQTKVPAGKLFPLI